MTIYVSLQNCVKTNNFQIKFPSVIISKQYLITIQVIIWLQKSRKIKTIQNKNKFFIFFQTLRKVWVIYNSKYKLLVAQNSNRNFVSYKISLESRYWRVMYSINPFHVCIQSPLDSNSYMTQCKDVPLSNSFFFQFLSSCWS